MPQKLATLTKRHTLFLTSAAVTLPPFNFSKGNKSRKLLVSLVRLAIWLIYGGGEKRFKNMEVKRVKLGSEEEAPGSKPEQAKETAGPSSVKASEKDKEFEVPLATINKILKAALPDGATCTKDAKSAFSKAAGIFVLYITACANDLAKTNKRSTITAQDIKVALNELGYGSYLPHLEATLEKMKSESAARKTAGEKKKKDASNVAAESKPLANREDQAVVSTAGAVEVEEEQ